MKKAIRKILILTLALMLFAFPAAGAYAATSTLVCTYDAPNSKFFQYEPGAYTLAAGNNLALSASATVAGTYFQVQAGYTPYFIINASNTPYIVQIYKVSGGLVYGELVSTGGTFISLPAPTSTSNYIMVVTALTTGSVDISSYSYFYQ